jgi:4-hydroxybenzoate-CoA ligase
VLDDFTERRPYNAVSDFVDANVARGLGNKVAFIDPDRSLTYGELQTRSVRFANALRQLGLRHEERVALLLHDTVDYPVAFWGTIRSGSIALPLNTFLNVSQYRYILADSRASALVAAMPLAQAIWPIIDRLPHLRTIILVGAIADDKTAFPGRDVQLFEDIIAAADATPFTADTVSDEVAFWLYTSGSTGDPKGVKHVHSNLMATAKLFGQGVLGITENDVVHSAAKLFFAYGLGNAMTFPMSVGATAALWPYRPSPEAVFEMMRKHKPTIFYGVPSLYTALLGHSDIGPGAGSDRLRLCVSAGEALPAAIGERWRQVVGVDVLDGIGSTELLQTFLSNRPGEIRYGSTGKPVAGYEARIIDDKGRELGAEEMGELIVRGPSAGEG